MSTDTLKSLFAYKAWANAELFALLEKCPPEQTEDIQPGIRTLNHIFVVDQLFRAHLSRTAQPFDTTNTRDTPTLKQLRGDVEATDAWYIDYVSTLSASSLREPVTFTFTDGDSGRMSIEEILLHIITHGGYHRGNVGQLLKSLSISPPRDLFTRFLHLSEPARRAVSLS